MVSRNNTTVRYCEVWCRFRKICKDDVFCFLFVVVIPIILEVRLHLSDDI